MDKARIYAVISKKNKAIYATGKTELQAQKVVDRLLKENVCTDASIFCNGASQLAHKRYDKYAWLVGKYSLT